MADDLGRAQTNGVEQKLPARRRRNSHGVEAPPVPPPRRFKYRRHISASSRQEAGVGTVAAEPVEGDTVAFRRANASIRR